MIGHLIISEKGVLWLLQLLTRQIIFLTEAQKTILFYLKPENWSKLSLKGLERDQYSVQKSRLLVSYVGIVGALLMLPTAILDIAFSHFDLIPVLFLAELVFLSVYWLNEKKYHDLARIWAIIGVGSCLFLLSNMVGRPNGVQLFYFPLIVCAYVFFEHNEYLRKVVFICFLIVLIFISEINDYSIFHNFGISRPPDSLYFIINLLGAVSLVIWIVDYIITINRKMENFLIKNEKQLLKLTDEISINNANLKKTNSELDSFVYSTSHDLRAPLKSILGLANLAKADPSGNQKEYIEMIEGRVNRLDDFIQE